MQLDPIGQAIMAGNLVPLTAQLRMGLEVQQHRTQAGKLSSADYPQAFGDQRQNPNIKNDFTQTQTELVTPPLTTVRASLDYLTGLNVAARRGLAETEQFWPLSMPPALSADLHEVALAEVTPANFMQRQAIVAKRSLSNFLVCRTHVNLSFAEPLFQRLYSETFHHQYGSYVDFRNALYLKVAQGFLRSRWLLTLLFGASPVAENNFGLTKTQSQNPVRSWASSRLTATNEVAGDYTSVDAYVSKINADVKQQRLVTADEFAGPVLLKGGGALTELPRQGVYYLELRLLDLNPTAANGVDENALTLIRLMAVYFAMTPAIPNEMMKATLTQADRLNEQVALENPLKRSRSVETALAFLDDLQEFLVQCQLPVNDRVLVSHLHAQLTDSTANLSARLWQHAQENSLSDWAQKQAEEFERQAQTEPYKLPGFTDLGLSSQAVVETALQSGTQVKVLDSDADILQLTSGQANQLLVNGTGTALNPQAMTTIIQNKVAAKQVLADAGVMVPASRTFKTAQQLEGAFDQIATNGITLKGATKSHQVVTFRMAPSREVFNTVVSALFAHNQTVMAEETMVGASYRFLVIGGQVVAVVERIPANVVGDGRSTVRQLLANKNARALRGPAFMFPQSQIKLGVVEQARLADYRLTLDSVITRGSQILLREDATFGNGADVLDVTEDIDQSYLKLVTDLANKLGLKVAGFDLILNNLYAPYEPEHPEMAVVLGVHGAPFLYPHLFPMFGKAQPVTRHLLSALFTESATTLG